MLNPSPSPSPGTAAVPTPRRTQNVPSRAPLPSVQPFPTFADPPTFPPETLATPRPTNPQDAALLALIPPTIGGHDLNRYTGRASDIGEGGDSCFAICPGELQDTARQAGADPEDVTWALGYAQLSSSTAVLVRAYRVPGATSSILQAWAAVVLRDSYDTHRITIAGRRVTLVQGLFPGMNETVYAVVQDDVLFLVAEYPSPADPEHPSDLVAAAFSLLP